MAACLIDSSATAPEGPFSLLKCRFCYLQRSDRTVSIAAVLILLLTAIHPDRLRCRNAPPALHPAYRKLSNKAPLAEGFIIYS